MRGVRWNQCYKVCGQPAIQCGKVVAIEYWSSSGTELDRIWPMCQSCMKRTSGMFGPSQMPGERVEKCIQVEIGSELHIMLDYAFATLAGY